MRTTFHERLRRFAVACAVGISATASAEPINCGPLSDTFDLTLGPGTRTEAAGPFFYHDHQPNRELLAFPGLFSHTQYPEVEGEEMDILYPLLTLDRYGKEYRWQFFQLLSWTGGQNQQEQMVRRFYLAPLYFQQRGPRPEDNYTALFPFYGTIRKKLMRDEVHFVMFPLYGQSRKRDVVTDNYLFPFFHLRHGDGLRGWQFWPLYGTEHKEVTTRTNDFDTVVTVPGHDNRFVLWPFYLENHAGIGTDNPEDTLAVLPFYSQLRSPLRDSTSVLYPLFNRTDDRGQKFREWDFPWPLWVIARGEGKTITRFIPFYSHGESPTMSSDSYLWPLYNRRVQHSPSLVRERTRFALYLYSEVKEKNISAGTESRRFDCWPLLMHKRTHDGSTRLQILAPLEPIIPNNKNVERNWSQLWSVWRSERNATNGASSQSLLWNLYRRDATPETRQVSFLFGLFQHRSTPTESRLRLFFIPVSTKKTAPK